MRWGGRPRPPPCHSPHNSASTLRWTSSMSSPPVKVSHRLSVSYISQIYVVSFVALFMGDKSHPISSRHEPHAFLFSLWAGHLVVRIAEISPPFLWLKSLNVSYRSMFSESPFSFIVSPSWGVSWLELDDRLVPAHDTRYLCFFRSFVTWRLRYILLM